MPKGVKKVDQQAIQLGWPKDKLKRGTQHPDHPELFFLYRTKKWGEYWVSAETLDKERLKIKKSSYKRYREEGKPTRAEYSKARNHLDQDALQTGSEIGSIPRGKPHPDHPDIVLLRYAPERGNTERWSRKENYEKQKAKSRERARKHNAKPEVRKRQREKQNVRYKNATPEQIKKRQQQGRETYEKRKASGKHKEYVSRPLVKAKMRANGRRYYRQDPERSKLMNKKTRLKRIANGKDREMRNRPEYKMVDSLRSAVQRLVVNKGYVKSAHTLELVGCTGLEFCAHIESQFEDWMTFENYGKHSWHLDHILPCAMFDLSDPEQQRICFNYQNYRPLSAFENWSKNAKIPIFVLAVILKHRYRVLTVK